MATTHDQFDRSSKWLIQHHGDSILRLSGMEHVESWRAVQAELVQPKQLPDGLLEVKLADDPKPFGVLVEIATYPERRLEEQVLRDAMLVLLDRRELPEIVTIVLRGRGRLKIRGTQQLHSRRGWAGLKWNWRVVELRSVPASVLLAANDVGLIPWVPLAKLDEPPDVVLRQCRDAIDRMAAENEHANLLVVAQILTRLRYNDARLLDLLGGRKAMIESPLIEEYVQEQLTERIAARVAARMQKSILKLLAARFEVLPAGLAETLQGIQNEDRLEDLTTWAGLCPDLAAFQARLATKS